MGKQDFTLAILVIVVGILTYDVFRPKKEPEILIQYHPSKVEAAIDTLRKYEKDTTVVRTVVDAMREITRYNQEITGSSHHPE